MLFSERLATIQEGVPDDAVLIPYLISQDESTDIDTLVDQSSGGQLALTQEPNKKCECCCCGVQCVAFSVFFFVPVLACSALFILGGLYVSHAI